MGLRFDRDRIFRNVSDISCHLRASVITSLREFKDDQCIEALIDALKTEKTTNVRNQILSTLYRLTKKRFRRQDEWESWWELEKNK